MLRASHIALRTQGDADANASVGLAAWLSLFKQFRERFAPAIIWSASAILAGKPLVVEEMLSCPSVGGDKSSPTTEISSSMGENVAGSSAS